MLCRSHAATAVCVPGDARSMVVARRADRTIAEDARALHDVRYARLGDHQPQRRSASRRFTLARGAAPPPPPPPPPMPASANKPRRRSGGGRAPVAVTLPMVTKSPVREAQARELAAAAKRAATAAASGDQVPQVRKQLIRLFSYR